METDSTVFVIDDDVDIRDGIVDMVEEMGFRALSFASAEEFLTSYKQADRECLVLDVRMKGMTGMELQAKLKELNIDIPIIIITGHGDIPMAAEAFKKGVVDFIEKPFREQVLWESIKQAVGGCAESRQFSDKQKEIRHKVSCLTERDMEVLKLLVTGNSDKQIAQKLEISRRAVAFHRTSILEKTDIPTIVEMASLIAKYDITI